MPFPNISPALPKTDVLFQRIEAAQAQLTPEERQKLETLAVDVHDLSSFKEFEKKFKDFTTNNDGIAVASEQGQLLAQQFAATIAAAEAQLKAGGPNQANLTNEVSKLKDLHAKITANGYISTTGFNNELAQLNGQMSKVTQATGMAGAQQQQLTQLQSALDAAVANGTIPEAKAAPLQAALNEILRSNQSPAQTQKAIGNLANRIDAAIKSKEISTTVGDGKALVDAATVARDAGQASLDNPLLTNKAAIKEALAAVNKLLEKAKTGSLTDLEARALKSATAILTRNTETGAYTNDRIAAVMDKLNAGVRDGTIDQGEFKHLQQLIVKITDRAYGPADADKLDSLIRGWEQAVDARLHSGVATSTPATAAA